MDVRDFLQLFLRERRLILIIIIGALVVGFLAYRLQSPRYEGEVLLSVTRQGSETTTEYQYDQFYRLQADEKMADMVARYLETALGRRETARRALLSDERETEFIDSTVTALRLAPSLVYVSYVAKTPTESERIAGAMLETAERYVVGLNEQAANRNWFTLVSSESLTRDGRFTLVMALGIASFFGFFGAFWIVLGRWYWRGKGKTLGE